MNQNEPPAAFADLREIIGGLHSEGVKSIRAGHVDLGKGLWLSCDPKGTTEMSCRPEGENFHLTISNGDDGWWTCLGMALPVERLFRGRYVGLLIDASSEGLVCFSPSLRYYFEDGSQRDVSVEQPVLLSAGRSSELAYVPLEEAALERAARCELNVFFHTERVALTVFNLEPLLLS